VTQPTCPKCGSHDVAGLVASFWAALDDEGEMKHEWQEYQSATEVTPKRMCFGCEHEWEGDE